MGSPGSPERALLAVTPRGRLEPDLLHVFSGDHGALLFKAESQVTMLG